MPAFIPKTLAEMRQLIDDYIINNTANNITPAKIRGLLQTVLDFCCTYFGNQEIQELDGASGVVNWDVQDGANAVIELTAASTTLTITNLNAGQYCTLILTQDVVGGRAIAFDDPTYYQVVGGGAGIVALTAAAGSVDVISFMKLKTGKYLVMPGYNFTNA